MKWMTKWSAAISTLLLAAVLLSGCGDKADLSVFMIPETGMPDSLTELIKTDLQQKMGDKTVEVFGSPIYNPQKLIVEYIAGEHDVLVISKNDFVTLIGEGGGRPLDDLFKAEDYPDGVITGTVIKDNDKEVQEKHLYGIPVKQAAMFKKVGFVPDDLFMIIPTNAPDLALAQQAMKGMVNP
jgi:hypothetical protein